MTRNMKYFLACLIILIITVVGVWKVGYAQTGVQGLSTSDEYDIKNVIENYFEVRYSALSYNQPTEVDEIKSAFSSESSSLNPELDKLKVEIQHAKKYQLRYSKYNLLLDFKEISFDPLTQLVSVSVVEGHDVIFEISEEITKSDPIVSSMRNLTHAIQLRKEIDGWKIVSDEYNDYLWRFIKATGVTTDDLIEYMDETPANVYQPKIMTAELDQEVTCSLPSEDISVHTYGRNGAINYARQWSTAPRPYNHPPYDDYTDFGGDCTNFVSQAIHEGGNAEMVFGGNHGIGTTGWYYYNSGDRATAWNNVEKLRDFIIDEYWMWDGGPEGCEVPVYEANEGDVIQYDWEPDATWNHTVIIIRSEDYGYHIRLHWVAGHTPDTWDYPFTDYIYDHPNMVYRLIHIVRIDGYANNYLPIIIKQGEGGDGGGAAINQQPYPYPPP